MDKIPPKHSPATRRNTFSDAATRELVSNAPRDREDVSFSGGGPTPQKSARDDLQAKNDPTQSHVSSHATPNLPGLRATAAQLTPAPLFSPWRTPAPISQTKNKSLFLALGSVFSAARVISPTGIDFDAASEEAEKKARAESPENVERSKGIAKLTMEGYLEFKSEPLRSIMPKDKDGKVWLSNIDMACLEGLIREKLFDDVIYRMSFMIDKSGFYVGFEAGDGIKIKQGMRQQGFQRVPVQPIEGLSHLKSKRSLARLSPATALALRAMHDEHMNIFKRIIAVAPKTVIFEATRIPIKANIFTLDALICIFEALAPSEGTSVKFVPSSVDRAEATHAALFHFLAYNSRTNLKQALPLSLRVRKDFDRKKDLLIQNSQAFISEIAFLLDQMVNFKRPTGGGAEDSTLLEVQTQEAAWRSAMLLSTTVDYLCDFEERLNANSAEAKRNITAGLNIIGTVLGATGSYAPLPQPAVEVTKASVQTFSSIIASHFGNVSKEYNPNVIANALANFIDVIRSGSSRGYLAVGMEPLTQTELQNLAPREFAERKGLGVAFEETFKAVLQEQVRNIKPAELRSFIEET